MAKSETWKSLQKQYPELVWRKVEYQKCEACQHIRHWHVGMTNTGVRAGGCLVRVGEHKDVKLPRFCDCKGYIPTEEHSFPVKVDLF